MTDRHPPNDAEAPEASSKPVSEPRAEADAKATRERVFVGTGIFWGLVVGVVLAVAVVVLAAQNTDDTTVAFLGWDFSTPLIIVILGTLVVGVVLDEVFGLVYRVRRRRTLGDRDELDRIKRSPNHTD